VYLFDLAADVTVFTKVFDLNIVSIYYFEVFDHNVEQDLSDFLRSIDLYNANGKLIQVTKFVPKLYFVVTFN
jgi:hypothetical protein